MGETQLLLAKRALIGPDLAVLDDAAVTIRDGIIVSVLPAAPDAVFPDGAIVQRFEDHTILPGLWNLHVHIQRRHLARVGSAFRGGAVAVENAPAGLKGVYAAINARAALTAGVTTIRDCSSGDHISLALRQAVGEGLLPGPRVIACGMGIAATGGHETHGYRGAVEADGPDAVRQAVRAEIAAGADFIKLMAGGGIGGFPDHEDPRTLEMTPEELTAAVDEAHRHGRRVTGACHGGRGHRRVPGCRDRRHRTRCGTQ